jgi:hypothetical protein
MVFVALLIAVRSLSQNIAEYLRYVLNTSAGKSRSAVSGKVCRVVLNYRSGKRKIQECVNFVRLFADIILMDAPKI